MAGPTRGVLRLLRAGAVAVVVVSVSAVAHVLGGGHAPRPSALLLAGLLCTTAFFVLSGCRLSTARIGGMLAAGQVALHDMFMAVGTSPMHGHAFSHNAMLAAHAVATVLATIVLLHGERALWAVWTWLNWVVRWPAVAVRVRTPAARCPTGFIVAWPPRVGRRGEPLRRGPPRELLTFR